VTSRWVVELSGLVLVRAKNLSGSHIATPGHRHERGRRLLVVLTSGPVPGEARSRRPGCRS